MGFTGRPAGPRRAALLATAAVAGLLLAVHGWSGRHSGLTPGALAAGGAPPPAPARSSPPAGPARSSRPAPAPAASRASPAARPGPLLSSEPFAAWSYQVWPGPPGAAARAALAGLSVSARRDGGGLSVTAGVNGQPPA